MKNKSRVDLIKLGVAAVSLSLLLAACTSTPPAPTVSGATSAATTPMAPHGPISATAVTEEINKINADPNLSPGARQMMLDEAQHALKHAGQ